MEPRETVWRVIAPVDPDLADRLDVLLQRQDPVRDAPRRPVETGDTAAAPVPTPPPAES